MRWYGGVQCIVGIQMIQRSNAKGMEQNKKKRTKMSSQVEISCLKCAHNEAKEKKKYKMKWDKEETMPWIIPYLSYYS